MNKGYLIEKYNDMGRAYTCRRLLEEAKLAGMDLQMIGAKDCYITADGVYNRGERLESRDFVLLRYKGDLLKREIAQLGRQCFNPLEAYDRYLNKFEQVKNLQSEAMDIPKWIMGGSALGYEQIVQELGSPFVVKGLESSMGREIWLMEDKAAFRAWQKQSPEEKEFLYQTFIRESAGQDMRLYCICGEIIAGMERISNGDFRANVALGAHTKNLEISPTFRQIGRDLYQQTGIDFMGIDLLHGKERPYFCEINVMPGIEGMERATGVNVAAKILERVRNKVKQG